MESLHYYLNYDVSEIIAGYCNYKMRKINLINRRFPLCISSIINAYSKHSLNTILNFGTSTCKYNDKEFYGTQNQLLDNFVPTPYSDLTNHNFTNNLPFGNLNGPIKLGIVQNENDFSFRQVCDFSSCVENIVIPISRIDSDSLIFCFPRPYYNINGISINIMGTHNCLREIIDYIYIDIGGIKHDKIYGYDLELLLKLYKCKIIHTSIGISFQLPFYFFQNSYYLPTILLYFHEFKVVCKLRSSYKTIPCNLVINKKYDQLYKYRFINSDHGFEQISLFQDTQIMPIILHDFDTKQNQLYSSPSNIDEPKCLTIKINSDCYQCPVTFIYFYFVSDGKIIRDKILESYELCFQNSSKIEIKTRFSSKEIECHKWKYYYIVPISKGSPLKQVIPTGTLNFSKIHDLNLKLNFTNSIKNYKDITLHMKTMHTTIIMIQSGTMGMKFYNDNSYI